MSKGAEIDIVSVSKVYGSTTAVHPISLKIPAATYCCLLGPSGCGKTSTLRMIAGHESLSSGDIRLGNTVVTDLPPAKRGTAMMFQSYALFPHLDLVDNVAFSLRMKGVDKTERRAKALDMLKLMQMDAYASRRPAQLSGGQQQRVALARALITDPGGAASGRAALGPRPVPEGAHARGTEEAADLARHQLRSRHPQPGGGDGPGGPDRGDERWPDRTGCPPAHRVRDAGHGIRRALHGRPQCHIRPRGRPCGRLADAGRSGRRKFRGKRRTTASPEPQSTSRSASTASGSASRRRRVWASPASCRTSNTAAPR